MRHLRKLNNLKNQWFQTSGLPGCVARHVATFVARIYYRNYTI